MKKRLLIWSSFLFLLAQITFALKPDLVPFSLSGPESVRAGEKISRVTFSILNDGGEIAKNFYVSLYITKSHSTSLSGAIYVGKFFISSLNPHQRNTYSWSINYTIPTKVNPGYHYLALVVDSSNRIPESNEANNQRFKTLRILQPSLPDLVPFSLSVPTNLRIGEKIFYVTFRVANIGDKAAGSFYVSLYIANNTTSLSGAHYIGRYLINSLGAHKSRTIRWAINYTVPESVPHGYRYLAIFIDSNNRVAEGNETNNKRFKRVRIFQPSLPDLVPSYLSAPVSVRAGEKISRVSFSISNNGGKTARNFYVHLYITKTHTPSLSGATYIGRFLINSLSPHQRKTYTMANNYTVPVSINPAYHYLAIFVDPDNKVAESNEANNKRFKTLRTLQALLPDLTFSYLSAPASAKIGDKISQVTFTVANTGGKNAGSFYVSLYLANNSSSLSGAHYIGRYLINSLRAHESRTIKWTINYTVPTSINPGYRYIAFFVDYTNTIRESNESNNKRLKRVRITQ